METWLEINKKLMPNGRLMVNCGGSSDAIWEKNSTINAMCKAFPGQVRKLLQTDDFLYAIFMLFFLTM